MYSFGVVMLEMITGEVQSEKTDLVTNCNTSQILIGKKDPSAGQGWDRIMDHLTRLALDCVKLGGTT